MSTIHVQTMLTINNNEATCWPGTSAGLDRELRLFPCQDGLSAHQEWRNLD